MSSSPSIESMLDCDLCSSKFRQVAELISHQQIFHPEEQYDMNRTEKRKITNRKRLKVYEKFVPASSTLPSSTLNQRKLKNNEITCERKSSNNFYHEGSDVEDEEPRNCNNVITINWNNNGGTVVAHDGQNKFDSSQGPSKTQVDANYNDYDHDLDIIDIQMETFVQCQRCQKNFLSDQNLYDHSCDGEFINTINERSMLPPGLTEKLKDHRTKLLVSLQSQHEDDDNGPHTAAAITTTSNNCNGNYDDHH